MSANITALCNAVVASLNGGTFTETFTAVYQHVPNYHPEGLSGLTVVVTDAGGTIDRPMKSRLSYMDSVSIVVLWQTDGSSTGIDTDIMDRALVTMDEITEHLIGRDLTGAGGEEYVQYEPIERGLGEKDKQHYFPQNLDALIFASRLVVSYRRVVSITGRA